MKISKRVLDLLRYFLVAGCGYLSSSEGIIRMPSEAVTAPTQVEVTQSQETGRERDSCY